MAEPTPHVPRPGRGLGTTISTEDLPEDQYVSNRVQAEIAVERAKAKLDKQKLLVTEAEQAIADAEAALASLPEE